MTDPKTVHVEPDVPGRLVEFVMSLTYDMPHVTAEDIGVIAYRLQHSSLARPPASPDLRAALVAGQKDAEAEHRKTQTGTGEEAYHNGRMVAYMDAVEAFDRAPASPDLRAAADNMLRHHNALHTHECEFAKQLRADLGEPHE